MQKITKNKNTTSNTFTIQPTHFGNNVRNIQQNMTGGSHLYKITIIVFQC
jgi:hypothetical protein